MVKRAMMRPKLVTPASCRITPSVLPSVVVGKRSPYPTAVTVVKAHQIPSPTPLILAEGFCCSMGTMNKPKIMVMKRRVVMATANLRLLIAYFIIVIWYMSEVYVSSFFMIPVR